MKTNIEKSKFIAVSVLATLMFLSCNKETKSKDKVELKTTNYVASVYNEVALGEIQPKGWLKDQLAIMRDNSTGHMDEIYDKIKIDNGWLGGKGDDWEETPYWLDGAVPLAYQLDDKKLQQKVKKYIDWSIENQRPSGYFGPITEWERETGNKVDIAHCDKGEDWWPRMVMLKVIQQYYTATQDKRVIPFMKKYFDYQWATLDTCPIGKWTEWAQSRGVENMRIAQWLYTITKDEKLLQLANKIKEQSFAWSEWLGNRDWVINAAAHPNGESWMHRHGVNVGMAIKEPAENYQRTGDSAYLKATKVGFSDLMTLHGLPNGIFSADEDLHGNAPIQGTELCAIVEAMFSLEEIIGITGDPFYMDALEQATFNALPAQTTDDFNEKQYFQIANQIEIDRGVYAFTLPFNREMNNVLGAKSGYTCCYVNMHQGWTKFTQHLWYKNQQDGLAALVYSPNTISTTIKNETVTVQEDTAYPFGDEIDFKISVEDEITFPFELRIPKWCTAPSITVNGEKVSFEKDKEIVTLNRSWKNGDVVKLKLPMEVRASEWAENTRAIERGPLVYGLKLNEKWNEGNEEHEGKYFTVHTDSNWNYGLLQEELKTIANNTEVIAKGLNDDFKWNLENAPLEIKVNAKQIPDWKAINGLAYLPVTGREGFYKGEVSKKEESISLVPIGFTKLRIVAFPVVK
ncbi:beta-L-arabinofuranosidase domain-containing protein [Galbibacter pacificus]|uniref:Glycoside hydrolase family 127 protein n=1 Tax=Galbibacter pacificus TaxID=2996052 RepID=A0ABT6FVC3_9FLAO|nr:beta-L-arabinofuranosidase domain-containing protein [Galbibacter pacificus]MDG3583864.1 glycoside hydrolase family 127 protein [Galbibacter pacificus]MDG3587218.1 glycoside hydrolase family 127 protein [Galbibacter pacificus]